MKYTIQSNVPRCPYCSGYMFELLKTDKNNKEHHYMVCYDCLSPFRVLSGGQAEVELLITDDRKDN